MKNEILRSFLEGDRYENDELNEKADEVKNYEKVISIVKEYETTIKTQKKIILNAVHSQGRVLKKFIDSDKFLDMVKELGVSKSTIYFKINVIKKLNKYPKLKNL